MCPPSSPLRPLQDTKATLGLCRCCASLFNLAEQGHLVCPRGGGMLPGQNPAEARYVLGTGVGGRGLLMGRGCCNTSDRRSPPEGVTPFSGFFLPTFMH